MSDSRLREEARRADVVRLLRAHLAMAEAGQIEAVAMVYVETGKPGAQSAAVCAARDFDHMHALGFGLAVLQSQLIGGVMAAVKAPPVSSLLIPVRQ